MLLRPLPADVADVVVTAADAEVTVVVTAEAAAVAGVATGPQVAAEAVEVAGVVTGPPAPALLEDAVPTSPLMIPWPSPPWVRDAEQW